MTLMRAATIPAEFIRFDTRVTDADQFFNVRDAQTARENLNVLIARRLRRVLLSVRFRRTGYTTAGQWVYGYGDLGLTTDSPGAYWLGPWRLWVPPFCKALRIRLLAASDNAGGDILVYPALRGINGGLEIYPSTNYRLTVTGTVPAEYELDFPLPASYSGCSHWVDLMFAYSCEAYGADEKGGAHQVVAWAEDRAVVATAAISGGVSSLLYFVSPAATINPQRIVRKDTLTVDGSTYYRAHVATPWNVMPQPGDTFDSRALAAFVPTSLTVIPVAITDFGTVAGLT
jgi:hypothetical protein